MREIEFRAWDKSKERMILNYAHVGKEGKMYVAFDTPDMDLELMQYTGLKDKNGTKIFEGDLVDNKENGLYKYPLLVEKDELQGFSLRPIQTIVKGKILPEVFIRNFNYIGAFEIIGNIYENPELLKVTND